jgi:STE24 endopeptidase
MQMTVLMVFALVLVLGESPDPLLMRASPNVLAFGAAAYWIVAAGLSAAISAVGVRRLSRGQDSLTATSRRHHKLQLLVQVWLLGGLALLLGMGILNQLAGAWPLNLVPLVRQGVLRIPPELMVLGMFAVGLLLHWLATYRFEHAIRVQVEQQLMLAGRPVRPGWTLRQYLDFQLRHQFLFVAVPVLLIMVARDAVGLLPFSPQWIWVPQAMTAAAVAAVFLFSPTLLVHVWRTRPMGDGELRRRIEALCTRLNLQYRQLRIWDTAGVIANAGVMGLHRRLRYVLVTDALLENMDDAQIVAVFGHEAGHIKHHHLVYFLVFTMCAMALSVVMVGAILSLLPHISARQADLVQTGVSLVTLALIWGVGFGWLSRRFERQADVYGAWCAGLDAGGEPDLPGDASDPESPRRLDYARAANPLAVGAPTFVRALENVGLLNGISPETWNWRHGSIASRVRFLKNWTVAGYSRSAFDRSIGRIKAILWLALLVGAGVAALTYRRWWTL